MLMDWNEGRVFGTPSELCRYVLTSVGAKIDETGDTPGWIETVKRCDHLVWFRCHDTKGNGFVVGGCEVDTGLTFCSVRFLKPRLNLVS